MAIDKAKIETFGFTRDDIRNIAKEAVKEDAAKLVDEAIDEGRINIADNVEEVLEDASSGTLTDLLGLDSEGKAKKQSLSAILQADKDILSQIVYDGRDDILIFPEYILPLRFDTENNTYYFNYHDMRLLDGNNNLVSYISINNNCIIIEDWEANIGDGDITNIDYMFCNGEYSDLNTYYLYHPITSGGTKLYKHRIYGRGSNMNNYIMIDIISPSSDPINSVKLEYLSLAEKYFVAISTEDINKHINTSYYSAYNIDKRIGVNAQFYQNETEETIYYSGGDFKTVFSTQSSPTSGYTQLRFTKYQGSETADNVITAIGNAESSMTFVDSVTEL